MRFPRIPGVVRRQGGVSLITAIFILLLFAALAALMANVVSTAHVTSAEDVLGSRAYQAARAGVEWGLYKIFEAPDAVDTIPASGDCTSPVNLPKCPTSAFPVADINGFAVAFNCVPFQDAAGPYQEGCRRIRIFRLTATATSPGPVGLNVEREVQVTAEVCRDAANGEPC